MFKSFIKEPDLIGEYPLLKNLIGSKESIDNYLTKAKDDVESDLYDKGYQSRLMMLPLNLLDGEDINSGNTTDSDVSDIDKYQRKRFYFARDSAASSGGTVTVTLKGCSTSDGVYEKVKIFTFSSDIREFDAKFDNSYSYYKCLVVPTVNLTNVTVNLYEVTFDKLLLYKTLEIFFRNKMRDEGDTWDRLRFVYSDLYIREIDKKRFGYDKDESGEFSVTEGEGNTQVKIYR